VKALRTFIVLGLVAALVLLLGAPLCFSEACPMSAGDRQACKAMGRECCGTRGGQIAHGPAAPVPVLAFAPAALSVAPPPPAKGISQALTSPLAAPAVLQDVGLFTLFAVFLI
jgi:hypothetical protein